VGLDGCLVENEAGCDLVILRRDLGSPGPGRGGSRFKILQMGKSVTMVLIKSLWASVQGDPVFMRRVNGWFTIFWMAMIPVSIVTGWISSVAYVAALSLWALVSGHWSAWQAARVEVTQQAEEAERLANPVEQRVVDKLVQSTTVEAV
jgi:hypothetical protein